MRCDSLWRDARLATMTGEGLGVVESGVIAAQDGLILFAGAADDAPMFEPDKVFSCDGRWITPGLIDCHTHLVYAGDRAHEFEMRLAGATYEDIARAGGGILSTVRATRAASDETLTSQSLKRLDQMIGEGVTTIEIKSGYGLSTDSEMRLLRIARGLADQRAISVTTTFLGAHACPPEITDKEAYIDTVCAGMIPAIADAGLADAVDAFCETIAFTPAQVSRVFAAAKRFGLPVKVHAEQLSNQGGAALAAVQRSTRAAGRGGQRRGDDGADGCSGAGGPLSRWATGGRGSRHAGLGGGRR